MYGNVKAQTQSGTRPPTQVVRAVRPSARLQRRQAARRPQIGPRVAEPSPGELSGQPGTATGGRKVRKQRERPRERDEDGSCITRNARRNGEREDGKRKCSGKR